MGVIEGINNIEEFHREILEAHNEFRQKHNTQTVIWSNELAKQAQEWADEIAKRGKFEHAPLKLRRGQGENISCASGKELTAKDATNMWYEEIKDFNFQTSKYNPKCGHFSQVIWANTTEIGAGKSVSNNGLQFVVCRYSPAGNMINTFSENVKPLGNMKNSPDATNSLEENIKPPWNMKNSPDATNSIEENVKYLENKKNSASVNRLGENVKDPGFKKNSYETVGCLEENIKPLENLTKSHDIDDERKFTSDNAVRTHQPTKHLIPSCKIMFQGMNLKFEMKESKQEKKELQIKRHETVEIRHLKTECRDPYYKSRTYFKQDTPYHILLHCQ